MNDIKNQFLKDLKKIIKIAIEKVCYILDLMFLILVYLISIYDLFNIYAFIATYILIQIIKSTIIRSRVKIPILKEKLTIENENGDILPKKGCFERIVIYCNVIEKFIDDNNLRN